MIDPVHNLHWRVVRAFAPVNSRWPHLNSQANSARRRRWKTMTTSTRGGGSQQAARFLPRLIFCFLLLQEIS